MDMKRVAPLDNEKSEKEIQGFQSENMLKLEDENKNSFEEYQSYL